jgi:carbon monoxide dehydrogenase subunit G
MISISEETVIPSSPDVVWPLLRDPAVVASCIPGAELSPESEGGSWSGSIKVKFGPTVAIFRGEAALKFDDATMTCTVEGRGIDQRGASRALASGKLAVTGVVETNLSIQGEFNVTGPLEAFANSGGVHVARALLGEFSTNLTNLVTHQACGSGGPGTDENASVTDAPKPQLVPAAELNAFSLLWKAFKSMLAGLMGLVGKKGH